MSGPHLMAFGSFSFIYIFFLASMKMMKSKIILLLSAFLCMGLPSVAETFRPALQITQSDGSSVKYCLEKLPVLSFENETLYVRNQGQTESYDRTAVKSLTYVNDPQIPSGIGSVTAGEGSAVTFYDHAFSVYTPQTERLAVYTLNGQTVWSQVSAAQSTIRKEYTGWTPGVYVLQCGSHSYKFIVR